MDDLTKRYNYVSNIIPDPEVMWNNIRTKTTIPYQVELQPGPLQGPICWLRCPYCYGIAAQDSGERLTPERYLEIMHELADGGVAKIVFAGYATDPLNYKHVADLTEIAINAGQIIGFHTKALSIDEQLLTLLTQRQLAEKSYFSVSVDAGSDAVYNQVHGIKNSQAKLLTRVLKNLQELTRRRSQYGNKLDISATYLVNQLNCGRDEIQMSIDKLRASGVDLIRFTFPQMPRKGDHEELADFVPDRLAIEKLMPELMELVEKENSESCQIIVRDMDKEFGTIDLPRSLPCFARFIFPTIGFDGWLYHCSESASPDFRSLALGNLATSNFWDCYYGYDSQEINGEILHACEKMTAAECKCDRKEHDVNAVLKTHVEKVHSDKQWRVIP